MNETGEALRQLHRIHRQLTDLRERLARGPKQIRAGESNVTCLEEDLSKTKEDIKAARIAADQKQLQLKVAEDRIEDLKGKLNACVSNREYQALREQIAADEMATSVRIGGLDIHTGDYLIGDRDGVVRLPKSADLEPGHSSPRSLASGSGDVTNASPTSTA